MDDFLDLIVVGAGPVGGLAANLAGVHGLRCLAVEASTDVHPLPRAIHFDAEIMRIFQFAGLADEVSTLTRASTGSVHSGADGEPIRDFRVGTAVGDLGWRPHHMFFQPELDALLRRRAAARDGVELALGVTCVAVSDHGGHVEATLRDADGRTRTVGARHLVACDGASSTVRRQLAIRLDDYGFEEPWIIIDVRVPDDSMGPEHMEMFCDPRRPGTYVPGPGNHRRWEFMLLEGEDPEAMRDPSVTRKLVAGKAPWLDAGEIELVRSAVYRFHGLVTTRWSSGRILLAGDAAHQTPPFYGQGMCHGMRDVHNLMWKLGALRRGAASDAVLQTYGAERDPHVRAVIGAAIENGRYICELDPEKAAARDADYRERNRRGTDVVSFRAVIPPLTAGLLDDAGALLTGHLLPQPEHMGELLDTHLGTGFALVCADPIEDAPAWFAERLGGAVVGGVQGLRELLGSQLALVRPDRHVFGTAAAGETTALCERLAAGLGLALPQRA